MESNYSNRDFEQFVKQNADEYRMFPSEKVWSGVNNALHTRRRWTGFGLAFLLLLTGGAVSWVMTMYPASKKSQDITSVTPAGNNTGTPSSAVDEPVTTQASEKKETRKIHGILPFSKEAEEQSSQARLPLVSSQSAHIAVSTAQPVAPSQALPAHRELPERREKALAEAPHARVRQQEPAATPVITPVEKEAIPAPAVARVTTAEEKPALNAALPLAPPTIQNVSNTNIREPRPRRISWQLFVTPTVSYRKLSTNKAFNNTTGTGSPFSPALTDVNQAVTHKPDLGLQLGFTARYPLSNSVKIRAGLQFNVNRYDIKAFSYTGEMATIGLNSPVPGSSSVSAYTNYRNYSGYRADWLKNFYYSISAPIGAELKLLGNRKTSFGIAGTIQPTYVLSDGAYLISTDYKNYAKVPWLTRNFNLSTGFEAFVNYTRGKTNWQIGPQVRYQLLSSFENKYPVKENLFDFGVKIGVSLNE